jgi:hypothetical protein
MACHRLRHAPIWRPQGSCWQTAVGLGACRDIRSCGCPSKMRSKHTAAATCRHGFMFWHISQLHPAIQANQMHHQATRPQNIPCTNSLPACHAPQKQPWMAYAAGWSYTVLRKHDTSIDHTCVVTHTSLTFIRTGTVGEGNETRAPVPTGSCGHRGGRHHVAARHAAAAALGQAGVGAPF